MALLAQLQLAGCIMHDIGSRYRVGELLGVGASSKVFLAEDIQTGAEVAVKIVSKKGADKDLALLKEATILRWSCHESVLQFLGIYEIQEPSTGQGAWAIVSEFVGGGELFEEVRKHGPLPEDRGRIVAHQLFSALDFLHHRGIVHRDIKTENVCKTGLGDEIKLVDFGLATPEWDNTAMLTRCGSPGYIAPEVLRGERYGCKIDCFSVGVLMYILLAGYAPFRGQSLEEMLLRNMRCKVSLRGLAARCSEEVKALVSLLLVPEAVLRPSAEECLGHEWFAGCESHRIAGGSGAGDAGGQAAGVQDVATAAAAASGCTPANSKERAGGGKRERRRLFSVQLGCEDMFYKGLRFASEDQLPGAAAPQLPDDEDDQYRKSFEMDTPLPNEVDTQSAERHEHRAGTHASGERWQPQEGSAVEEGPRPTLEMLRTCEPLWADVQRTLSNMKVQGLLPEHAGLKKVHAKMQQYANGVSRSSSKYSNGRARGSGARPRNDEEVERNSAFFARDLGPKQSIVSSCSFSRERKTAFFHRDLRRGESHSSAALLADERQSFSSNVPSVAQSRADEDRNSAFFTRSHGPEGSESDEDLRGPGDDATEAAFFAEVWSHHSNSGSSDGEGLSAANTPLSLRRQQRHVKRMAARRER